jgi:4'-phosphopantetheinyl transferase
MISNKLEKDIVHLYAVSSADSLPYLTDFRKNLSASEIARAERFKSPEEKARFIIGRTWLRRLLGSYLSLAPLEIQVLLNRFGKPVLDNAQNGINLRFNLSHSGDLIVYSFCLFSEIGIDTEKIDHTINHLDIAEQFCTEKELCYLKDSSGQHQLVQNFFRIWTRKEALLKAFGTGLSPGLKEIEVLNDNISFSSSASQTTGTQWRVSDVHIDNSYKTAFATSGSIEKVIFEHLQL